LSPFLLGCFVLRARPWNAETVLFTVFSFPTRLLLAWSQRV
jgi:hypothetical protein